MRHLESDVYIVTGITLGLASTFIVLRFFARRMTKVALWWDDWFALLAYASALGWTAAVLGWTIEAGLGRPLDTINLDREVALTKGRLYLYVAELMYAFSLAFSKMSILGMYWRLFSTSGIRRPIQGLFVASVVWLIIRTFMAVFHCVPVHAFWDHSVEGARCDINDSEFFFGTVLVHLLIDLVVLALPVMQVRNLHLRLGQKVGVIGLFMFGILVCVASVVVLVESKKFNPYSDEMPLEITPIMVWATVEVNFAIVSACLPMMRPIARRLLPGSVLASDPNSYPTKSGTGHKSRDHRDAIKLRTVTRTAEVAGDDSSSTKNLADLETGSTGSRDDVDDHHHQRPHGGGGGVSRTVIRGPSSSVAAEDEFDREGQAGSKGIHVKNEMSVSYERV